MATESIIRITQVANLDSRLTAANTQANTARDTANTAYNQANAAYTQANNAYLAANNSNLKLGGVVSGTLNVTQDLIVGGNLYLGGNTTYINVTTFSVNDSIMYLASNNELTDTVDIGFVGGKNTGGTYSHTGLIRHATDQTYYLFDNYTTEPTNNIIDVANSTYALLKANISAQSILLGGNAVATSTNTSAAYGQANAAYDKANTAYNQANSAYGQANAVYGASNTVYAQANAAYSQANASYGQANSAYAAANSAANTVRVSQNSGSTLSAKQLNFVNTANVTITVTDAGDGNANIAIFSAAGGGGGGGGDGNANVTISDTAPSGPRANQDFWWNSNTGTLKIYYNDGDSSQWVDAVTPKIGPQGPQGPSGPFANVIVRANSASTQNNVALNFVNTATISVSVTAGSSGNANIAFSTAGASESFHPFLLGI